MYIDYFDVLGYMKRKGYVYSLNDELHLTRHPPFDEMIEEMETASGEIITERQIIALLKRSVVRMPHNASKKVRSALF